MNLIYLALLYGLIATSYVRKSEARLHAESIIGGTAAALGQYTYAVSIQINDRHLCGGGILNNRYIITVAHCFTNKDTNQFINREYIVVAGVIHAHNKQGPHRVERDVAKIYILQEFNPMMASRDRNSVFADIAVLELTSDLGLNQFITNVILPHYARVYPTYENYQADVCGYGHNWIVMSHDKGTNKEVEVCSGSNYYERRFAQVIIRSNMACRHFFEIIMDSQLCGNIRQRSPTNHEGLSRGDSGSPLVINNTIIGVVNTSPLGCREDLKPALYTRITSFIPFIRNAMNGFKAANMRLATYEVEREGCSRLCKKVLVEH